jgi:hypothetical protein
MKKVLEDQERLELNRTRQLLICVDDVNIFSEYMNTINEKAEALLQANGEVGLKLHTEKIKHKILSHHQNAEQNYNKLIAYKCFENVANFN